MFASVPQSVANTAIWSAMDGPWNRIIVESKFFRDSGNVNLLALP